MVSSRFNDDDDDFLSLISILFILNIYLKKKDYSTT